MDSVVLGIIDELTDEQIRIQDEETIQYRSSSGDIELELWILSELEDIKNDRKNDRLDAFLSKIDQDMKKGIIIDSDYFISVAWEFSIDTNDFNKERAINLGLDIDEITRRDVHISKDPYSVLGEKSSKSSAVKTIRSIMKAGFNGGIQGSIKDGARVTLVIDSYDQFPALFHFLREQFPDLSMEFVDHKERKYHGIHMKTSMLPGGVSGEIQVVTPDMAIANKLTHDLYDDAKPLKNGDPKKDEINRKITLINTLTTAHNMQFEAVMSTLVATMMADPRLEMGNDVSKFPDKLIETLSQSNYDFHNGAFSTPHKDIINQQTTAFQKYTLPAQEFLVEKAKLAHNNFNEYKKRPSKENEEVNKEIYTNKWQYFNHAVNIIQEDIFYHALAKGAPSPLRWITKYFWVYFEYIIDFVNELDQMTNPHELDEYLSMHKAHGHITRFDTDQYFEALSPETSYNDSDSVHSTVLRDVGFVYDEISRKLYNKSVTPDERRARYFNRQDFVKGYHQSIADEFNAQTEAGTETKTEAER